MRRGEDAASRGHDKLPKLCPRCCAGVDMHHIPAFLRAAHRWVPGHHEGKYGSI